MTQETNTNMPAGQEGTTGNDQGRSETNVDRDHGNMDFGNIGGAHKSEHNDKATGAAAEKQANEASETEGGAGS